MAIIQPLIDLAEICYAHGIRHAVISPGSRSAALTLAFSRHKGFETLVVMDERSAGFIALGMAQQLQAPVVLICTSGSAAYNYAPAIAEAFFQQIPLLVLTADRPKEWIHQFDGQTIFQSEIYGKHVKRFFEIPSDYAHPDALWMVNRSVNEAILSTTSVPQGPVHINVPIREPFYPAADEHFEASGDIRIIKRTEARQELSPETWNMLLDEWDDAGKILIVAGQYRNNSILNKALLNISEGFDIPIVADTISNVKGENGIIRHQDIFLSAVNRRELKPDLLITYGLSLISKKLKQFLRENPALKHWHIGEDLHVADPFQSLTRQIPLSPEYFFHNVYEKLDYQLFVQNADPEQDSFYNALWQGYNANSKAELTKYLDNLTSLNDLSVVNNVIIHTNSAYQLHIANSMPIRYVNVLGNLVGTSEVFCNRGTSGIDGCVSTAVGAALCNNTDTLLITGDVAFLYDRNGLLINRLPDNLKIVVINNAGGNIFSMIDGPAHLPELGIYFKTTHQFTAKRTADDSNIRYFYANNMQNFDTELQLFLGHKGTAILEVFTDPAENVTVWKGLKQHMKERLL